jgi:hypothetical protein
MIKLVLAPGSWGDGSGVIHGLAVKPTVALVVSLGDAYLTGQIALR